MGPRLSDEELEEEYRDLGRDVRDKIGEVARLLDPRGIDEFARTSDFAKRIDEDFPSLSVGSLAAMIQQAVFWPRNRILHHGFLDHSAEEAKRKSLTNIPAGRYGEIEEFGRVAAFLLSPAASYVTGATVQVDGGLVKSVL